MALKVAYLCLRRGQLEDQLLTTYHCAGSWIATVRLRHDLSRLRWITLEMSKQVLLELPTMSTQTLVISSLSLAFLIIVGQLRFISIFLRQFNNILNQWYYSLHGLKPSRREMWFYYLEMKMLARQPYWPQYVLNVPLTEKTVYWLSEVAIWPNSTHTHVVTSQ